MYKDQHCILIVEDEKLSRLALADILNKDHKVFLAKNGEQAIELANNNDSLDLIILDVVMDGIDGFEVCNILKGNEKTGDIPILFISALSNIKNKVKGFALGGIDYITKPFQADEVIARVNNHLALSSLKNELEVRNELLEDEIDKKNILEKEQKTLIAKLQNALSEVKRLQGLIPICANCKNIRNDYGYWEEVEIYIKNRSDANFSHSICPVCVNRLYPDLNLTENE